MSDLPVPETAITAEVRILAEEAFARLHSDRGYTLAQCLHAALNAVAPLIDAAARASERETIRRELLDVITANVTAGNDTVYGALLDAIRELGGQP